MSNHLTLVARDHAKDAGLARRALSGDRGAQHELLRSLKPRVHSTLYRVLGANEHMEELLSDAFVEVFRRLPEYRADSDLDTWAARLAARVALEHLRRKPSKERDKPAAVQLHLVPPPGNEAHREGMKRYYAHLRRLKPKLHTALALVMLDGRSLEEVAELTGMSAAVTRHRIDRARRELRAAARRDPDLMGFIARDGAPHSVPSPELLSPKAWERVESRLFERLGRGEHLPSGSMVVRGPAPVRVWLAAAGLVLAGTMVLWWGIDRLHHHTSAAHPFAASVLEHEIALLAELGADAPAGALSSAGEARLTTTAVRSRLLLGPAELNLAPHSDVRVSGDAQTGFHIELAAGELDCDSGGPAHPVGFGVRAGAIDAQFTTARFRLSRTGTGADLIVSDGRVHVRSGTREVELGPGERWTVPSP